MKDRFRVLIICSCHWPALARLPKLLHQAGCTVDLYAPPNVLVGQSRYLSHHYPGPKSMLPFLTGLKQHLENHPPYDWVIPGDDPLMYALTKKLDEPWIQALYPAKITDNIPIFLLSKSGFPLIGKTMGLPVPNTHVCPDSESALAVAAQWGYPLLIKNHLGFGGSSIRRVNTPLELVQGLSELNLQTSIIVQEDVQGITGSAVMLYQHGQLRGWVSYLCERMHPGPFSPSTTIRVQNLPGLEPILVRLGEATEFHGLCGVDLIYNPDNQQITLLEQHARPAPMFYMTPSEGSIDFARAIRRMLEGQPPESPRYVPVKKPRSRPLFHKDLHQAIDESDWPRLLAWLTHPGWWRDIPWDEPQIAQICFRSVYQKLLNRFFPGKQTADQHSAVLERPATPACEASEAICP